MNNRKLYLAIGVITFLLLVLHTFTSWLDDDQLRKFNKAFETKEATGYFAKRHDIHFKNVTSIFEEIILAPGSNLLTQNSNAKKQHVFTSGGYFTNESCMAVAKYFREEFKSKGMALIRLSERDTFTSADMYFYCLSPYSVTLTFQQQRHFSTKSGCNYSIGVSWDESPFSDCKSGQ